MRVKFTTTLEKNVIKALKMKAAELSLNGINDVIEMLVESDYFAGISEEESQ